MSAAPQGSITFPGLDQILGGSVVIGHGLAPGKIVVTVPPQADFPSPIGDCVFAYDDFYATFPDCKVDRFEFHKGDDGKGTWSVYILDRRWRWASRVGGGQVSGYYNTRRNDNEVIKDTIKSAKDLAKLCLEAMGESGYDLSDMPEDVYPQTEWDYAYAPEALQQLCDQLGMRIVMTLDSKVRLKVGGVGATLPNDETVLEDSLSIDVPELPDTIILVAGKNRYQGDFKLEAVAKDVGGKIVPLRYASYFNDIAMSDFPNFLNIADEKLRALAKESAFRWFARLEELSLPGVDEDSIEVKRILPFENEQVATQTIEGDECNLPAWVFGRFWSQSADKMQNNLGLDKDGKENEITSDTFAKLEDGSPLLATGWTLDQKHGIVKFSDVIYAVEKSYDKDGNPNGVKTVEPSIYLRCAVSLRDKDTRAWLHRERKRTYGTSGSKPRYILKPEISWNVEYVAKDDSLQDNAQDVDDLLDYYLDKAEAEYQFTDPRSITYGGWRKIDLDGAIQQYSLILMEDSGKAITRASRNREELDIEISYKDRRLSEKIQAAVKATAERDREAEHGKKKGAPAR